MTIQKIGKYTVVAQLGTGAHSTILQINRADDGRHYALKIVPIEDSDDRKYLLQAEHEFRVAQMLDHPNIVKIYTLEKKTDWLFRVKQVLLLIEFVPGNTLDRMTGYSIPRLVRIFAQVAAGMCHMHRRGVFHADLKPGNILVNSRNHQPKIIDFGLAHIKGEDKGGRIQGTPEYMAPESVQGIINERTDIYNLGATMYRMVTFQHPPPVVNSGGRLGAKQHGQLLKPVRECNPAVPQVLADLIHSCLEFSPEKRPERMSLIQNELDRLADEFGIPDDE